MGAIYGHGGHLDLRTMTTRTYFQSPFNTRLHMKFEEIWPRDFRGEVVQWCERTKGRTDRRKEDGRRTGSEHKSSSWAFGSGQLKRVRENSKECHNRKPQPFQDTKRKRRPTKPTSRSPSKTPRGRGNRQNQQAQIEQTYKKIISLSSPSEVIAMLKGLKNTSTTITQGKTENKSPRRMNHTAMKSKTNTGTAALERSVEKTTGVCLYMEGGWGDG